MQVEMPLLEPSRGCCQCAHIRISVGRGQGLTFYRRARSLRGDESRRALGHFPVFLGDSALGMRRPADGHAAVADVDVRVVVFALGELGEPVHEGDRRGERRQLELPHERARLLLPFGHPGSIPRAGPANAARTYKTAKECVNQVTGTSYGGRGAATAKPQLRCFAATGATRGAPRSRSPAGAHWPTTSPRMGSSARSPRSALSTKAVPSGPGRTRSSPTPPP